MGVKCITCGFMAKSAAGLAVHKSRKHNSVKSKPAKKKHSSKWNRLDTETVLFAVGKAREAGVPPMDVYHGIRSVMKQ